jgi:phosphatidylethanolamine-binding protein (PEBP) family uncharacterized protein
MHPIEFLLTPLGRAFRNRRADERASIANEPALDSPNRIVLTSPAFDDGGEIPAKNCAWLIGENISPPLRWDTLPVGTSDVVLLIEDLDAPGTRPRVHTIAAFAPDPGGLAEGALSPDAGVRFLPRGGRPGRYAGPRPLPGHGPHRYRFHLYAIDDRVDLTTIPAAEELPSALEGHILGVGTLMGTRTA